MLWVGVMMLLKTRAKFTWRYAMQWHTKNHETYKVVLFVLCLAEWLIPSFNGRTTSHFHKIMVCAVLINDSDAKMYEKWQFKWAFFLLMHHAPPHNSHSAVAKSPVKNHCELSIRNARQYAHNSLKVVTLSKTGCYANVSIVVTIVTFSFLGVHWHQIGCCVLYIYRCTVYHNEGVYCTWFRRVH